MELGTLLQPEYVWILNPWKLISDLSHMVAKLIKSFMRFLKHQKSHLATNYYLLSLVSLL